MIFDWNTQNLSTDKIIIHGVFFFNRSSEVEFKKDCFGNKTLEPLHYTKSNAIGVKLVIIKHIFRIIE